VCRPDGSTLFKSDRAPGPPFSCEASNGAKPAASHIVQVAVRVGAGCCRVFDFDGASAPCRFRVLMLHDLSFVEPPAENRAGFRAGVRRGLSVLLLALADRARGLGCNCAAGAEVLIGDIRGKRFLDDAESPPLIHADTVPRWREVLAEAEEKQRLEIDFHENWTPQALRQVVRDHLHSAAGHHRVEFAKPYIHNFRCRQESRGAGPRERQW